MPVASGTAITRFGMGGWGTRRAGSFAGKAEDITVPPTISGLEYTAQPNRLHYTMTANLLHFTMPDNRLHFTFPEDD